jgi:hypothetical protein
MRYVALVLSPPVRRLATLLALALAAAMMAVPAAAGAKTVWLCRPGLNARSCAPSLSTASYSPSGRKLGVQHPKRDAAPPVDCFYVYPTVSDQKTTLANFHIDPVERSIALYQAARYSQHCRVFAPMYRQVTLTALVKNGTETAKQLATGVGDVRRAFKDYLAHDNHGRGFVLIGHSQGSFVLRTLIARDVDTKPAVRRRMLSAILLGGDVLVKKGSTSGGDFKHIPACRSTSQLHCVVAFSTFDTPVLSNSLFGRSPVKRDSVLCTNPAALGGGSGTLDSILPTAPFTPSSTLAVGIALVGLTLPTPHTEWIHFPGSYTARCSSANGAHVLQITPKHGAQTPHPSPDGTWGLHLLDANIALGNLVDLVHSEGVAFAHSH